jgi:hypothetical protein
MQFIMAIVDLGRHFVYASNSSSRSQGFFCSGGFVPPERSSEWREFSCIDDLMYSSTPEVESGRCVKLATV